MILTYKVTIEYSGKTIKEYLQKQGISHRLLLTLKQKHCIFCNGISVFTNEIVNVGDIIVLDLNYEEEAENIVLSPIALDIIHEDDALLIINKPAGITVHPSLHYYSTSLSNGVKYYFNNIRYKEENKTC